MRFFNVGDRIRVKKENNIENADPLRRSIACIHPYDSYVKKTCGECPIFNEKIIKVVKVDGWSFSLDVSVPNCTSRFDRSDEVFFELIEYRWEEL